MLSEGGVVAFEIGMQNLTKVCKSVDVCSWSAWLLKSGHWIPQMGSRGEVTMIRSPSCNVVVDWEACSRVTGCLFQYLKQHGANVS